MSVSYFKRYRMEVDVRKRRFDLADLHAAVKQALHLGAVSFDAVKHLVLCRAERRPPKLDLDIYPYLPRATVEKTSAKAYMRLLDGEEELV